VKNLKTSYEKMVEAYLKWVAIPCERHKDRVAVWENYVAIRDGAVDREPVKARPEGARIYMH
jgi:hypothetical protein